MSICKRDGSIEQFDTQRIRNAVEKAMCRSKEYVNFESVILHVQRALDVHHGIPGVDDVHDAVEAALMQSGNPKTAKEYILFRNRRNQERTEHSKVLKIINGIETNTPWGPVGYITYKRTYSRNHEEFKDTVARVITACQTQLGIDFKSSEIADLYKDMMQLKFSVAGRFLWQLGTHTVSRYGLASLQNCAFVAIDSPIEPFTWIFDMLMLGVGVGINIQRTHVSQLPVVKDADVRITRMDTNDADHIVPDSREGWVGLLERVLHAYFVQGKSFSYSTILIRSKGSVIKGFGGIASGPEDLCIGINNIQTILQRKRGQHLSTVDCLDIVCIIASIVVAGNIRRSAVIALGDYDDIEFLNAKRWDLGNIPNWRCMSNNSVICNDTALLPEEFWDGYRGNGEPYGLVNVDLARKVGRLCDGSLYPDPDVCGTNPCGEQSLANNETCCLAELFLPNIESFEEAKRVAGFAYRICKHSLMLDCQQEKTAEIVHKNMRMGIGVTGYQQASMEQKKWLDPLYRHLRILDAEYSEKIGVPKSIKLTSVKPSGTLSLLAGVTPGIHPGIFQYFIRRISISATNPLIQLCRRHGYNVEARLNFDGTRDLSTYVVEFPCKFPEGTRLAKDCSAVDQLKDTIALQTAWSDNSVSVTVYYKQEELEDIRKFLSEMYSDNIKAVSFLLHHESGFKQMPYEEITKDQYTALLAKTKPITFGTIDLEDDYSAECPSGACPLK